MGALHCSQPWWYYSTDCCADCAHLAAGDGELSDQAVTQNDESVTHPGLFCFVPMCFKQNRTELAMWTGPSRPARVGWLGSCCLHFSLTRMVYQNGTEAVAFLLSLAIGMETDTKRFSVACISRSGKRASCDAKSTVQATAATIKSWFMFWRNYVTRLVSSYPAFPFYIVVAQLIDFLSEIFGLWLLWLPLSFFYDQTYI